MSNSGISYPFVAPVHTLGLVQVTVTVFIFNGVGEVVVVAVMPQQEQALLYFAGPAQAAA